MKEFLIEKYGEFITTQFLTGNNEVIHDNLNRDGAKEQKEVIKVLKSAKNIDREKLILEKFWNANVEWGFDFSSWIGDCKNKDYLFIGAEPHIGNNYQLVYDFRNLYGKPFKKSALIHYKRESDIWHYITKIFVQDLTDKNIIDFLNKCYITDLCHIVPKHCGQVKDICKKLSIKPREWREFRSSVAKRYLLKEIEAVNPKRHLNNPHKLHHQFVFYELTQR
ncbi:hypothetical protein EMN47_12825 [Prolixibacteraceae bacterium JC049]|nr:hypothetical protein [Prolixibacteraceae bacterium JC049]